MPPVRTPTSLRALDHFSKLRERAFHQFSRAGHPGKDIPLRGFNDCARQSVVRARSRWSARHPAHISAFRLHVSDFTTAYRRLLGLRLDLIFRFFELAKPAVHVRLSAASVAGTE